MNKLKLLKVGLLGVFVSILFFSGCAWQRIPDPPAYNIPSSIPLNVGIALGETPATQVYGPGVVKHLKEMGVFKSIIYPYREGDPVDGILKITITGGWKGSGFGAGFLIGLSLFTLSPVIGPSMTGIHVADVILFKDLSEVAKYSIHAETSVSWGLGANTAEVGNKTDELQRRKLAVEIANSINNDRARILREFGK
ncbi:MAG: hypothetical protein FD156_951 [Nitrospirae bacterium]|nr:MAG: hypothetical protein FD156_951 [Nitrospirota bacterium]